jgi:SAM-dependent methyltransferase
MKLIERNECAVTHARDLEHLYTFKQFPTFMGCTVKPESEDVKADMSWWISKSSGLIQLKSLLPLDVLYPEAHGAGSVGELWRKHHRAFAEYIHKQNPSAVFEIGGAHGILANEFQEMKRIPWTILEPNPFPEPGCKAEFIKGFFDSQFRYSKPFDAVVHSHVFEHMYDPDEFMRHLSKFLGEGKRLIFSVPNLAVMLEKKFTNFVNFEHTLYLTEPYIEYLLAKHGFRFIEKTYFLEDHSIFFTAIRDNTQKAKSLNTGFYIKNKILYEDYIIYHKNLIEELNTKIKTLRVPVYLFGAHVFTQFLLAFGLNTEKIICILDNDSKKQGKRFYGTPYLTDSPKILKQVKEAVIILKAGVFNNEIKKDILDNINNNSVFLE